MEGGIFIRVYFICDKNQSIAEIALTRGPHSDGVSFLTVLFLLLPLQCDIDDDDSECSAENESLSFRFVWLCV